MKKRILKQFLFTLMGILFLNVANAQWDTSSQTSSGNEVSEGSTFNYRVPVVGANTYVWSIDGGGTLTDNGTSAGFDQASILWTTAGTYTVTVIETTPDLCSTTNTFQVTVIGNTSTITFVANTENCADDIPAVTTNFTSDVTFTGGTAPWTIVYDVDGGADQTVVLTDAGGTSITFGKDFTNNPGGADQSQIITIKDAYDKYGLKPSNKLDITTNNITVTYTMHEVPNTSAIQHD